MIPCPWCAGTLIITRTDIETNSNLHRFGAEEEICHLKIVYQCHQCRRYITTWTPMVEQG